MSEGNPGDELGDVDLSVPRDVLERMALECVGAGEYYELADSVGEMSDEELWRIVLNS